MAHTRPDLFYAYVGQAQIVNWWSDVTASYARVMQLARDAHDQQAIDDLTSLGPPPWNKLSQWPLFRKYEQLYQKKIASSPPKLTVNAAYASAQERAQWHEADDNGWVHFIGLDFAGPLTKIDLPSLGTNFSVPIFMIQGDEDLTAVPEISKAYFDSVSAPRKRFFTVPDTGHEPSIALWALTRKVLLEDVRPLTSGD
jgi:pimeloyl-ACP methyl ester carboxylesterase